MSQEEKRMLDQSILSWMNYIEHADNVDPNYWQGMTELEFVMAKVIDRLLIKYNRAPTYPQKRKPVYIRLREVKS